MNRFSSASYTLFYVVIIPSFLCLTTSCRQSSEEVSTKAKHATETASDNRSAEPDLSEFKKLDADVNKTKQQAAQLENKTTNPVTKEIVGSEKKKETVKKQPVKKQPVKKPVKTIVKKPAIEFVEPIHDFGEITEGDIIKHKFKFKNTGNAELIIKTAHASCGCTDPSFPFMGIPPGETGFIGVTYNSVSKDGPQKPDITITSNANKNPLVLYLSGNVKPKEKEKESEEKVDSTKLKKS